MSSNGYSARDLSFDETSEADYIIVDAVAERRGVVIKHVEYAVGSKKNGGQVHRRYKDFEALRELLLLRFTYRIIPKLPPKRMTIGLDTNHIEERRRALQRFLNILIRHPVISSDVLVTHFLSEPERDIYQTIKTRFATLPDEYFVNPNSLKAQELIHGSAIKDYKKHRENIQRILITLSKLQDILLQQSKRYEAESHEFRDIEKSLVELTGTSNGEIMADSKCLLGRLPNWLEESESGDIESCRQVVSQVATQLDSISKSLSAQGALIAGELLDKLTVLTDVIGGYQELCQRHEKGVTSEHHRAIRQLQSLKKLTSGGNSGMTENQQNLEAIERTIQQRESEIAGIEQRNAFSRYCIQEETRLVYCYMATLRDVLKFWSAEMSEKIGNLAKLWKAMHSETSA